MRLTAARHSQWGHHAESNRTGGTLIRADRSVAAPDAMRMSDASQVTMAPAPDVDPPALETGMWRLDLETGAQWWSPEMYAILGVDPATFEPDIAAVASLFDGPERERMRWQEAGLRRAPEPVHELYWRPRPGEEPRVIEFRGWVIDAGATRPREMAGICRDITQTLGPVPESGSLARRDAALLTASGYAICGLDAAGAVTFGNPALARLMGRPGERLEGARLHDLVHRDPDGTERHPPDECPLATASPGGEWSLDPTFGRGDGSWIAVGYRRVDEPRDPAEGGPPGSVLALHDRTGRDAPPAPSHMGVGEVHALTRQPGTRPVHVVQAEERERLRIAAEVHDDLVQALDAVALRLSNAGERLPGDRERDVFVDAEIDVRGVAERLRRLMFELMPPLEGRNLREAVRTYCSVVFAQSPMRWEVVGEVGDTVTDNHLVAYRVIQEALRNALAHSQGTRVEVHLEETGGELRVRVSDDGRGLDGDEAPPTHAGLRLIRRRAEASGGHAAFGTGLEGRGTALSVRLPVSPWTP